jgi:hypothetical protein
MTSKFTSIERFHKQVSYSTMELEKESVFEANPYAEDVEDPAELFLSPTVDVSDLPSPSNQSSRGGSGHSTDPLKVLQTGGESKTKERKHSQPMTR